MRRTIFIKACMALLLGGSCLLAGELEVNDGLIIHLDAGEITGLSDGDSVMLWSDLTSDSLDGSVSPAGGWGAPEYISTALNGQPGVSIAASDLLVSDSGLVIPDVDAGFTIFMVATGDRSGATAERLLHFGDKSGTPGAFIACDLSTSSGADDAGSGARFNNGKMLVNSGNPVSEGFHIVGLQVGQGAAFSEVKYFVDSVEPQVFNNTSNTGNTVNFAAENNILALGSGILSGSFMSSDSYEGLVCEVLVYNKQLSGSELSLVNQYLFDKYFTQSLIIHLDAGTLTGLNDGDTVSLWQDKSTDDSVVGDAAAVSGWSQPIYKGDILNSRPVVRMQGSDMLASEVFSLASVDNGLTVFMVATGDTSGVSGERAMQIGQAASNGKHVLGIDLSTDTLESDGGSGGRFNGGKALVKGNNPMDTNFHIISMQIAQGGAFNSLKYCVDDLTPEVFDNLASGGNLLSLITTNNLLTVGTGVDASGTYMSSDDYSGDIAEIMIYNDMLDDEEMADVYDYLYQKYFYSIIRVSPEAIELEEGQSVILNIWLDIQPSANVVLTLEDGSEHSQLEIGSTELVFTPENWDQSQAVTVTAIDDVVLEAQRHTGLLKMTAVSQDSQYNGISKKKSITIVENECGRWGYIDGDFNEDCKVDIKDFVVISRAWLWCDPMKDDNCFNLN